MKLTCKVSFFLLLMIWATSVRSDDSKDAVKERVLDGPDKLKIKVRMEGPYTAEVPLQVVCYFKYTTERAGRLTGAPVELDKRIGGVIGSLRERGEFAAEPLETILIVPQKGTIPAKGLLLIGIGDEETLSLKLLEGVGRVAFRTAAELGTSRVAFAPLLRDQGSSKLGTGDVETAVVRGMLLARDTNRRMQAEGLAKSFVLEEWNVEAGPAYFDETITGVQTAIKEASMTIEIRRAETYLKSK